MGEVFESVGATGMSNDRSAAKSGWASDWDDRHRIGVGDSGGEGMARGGPTRRRLTCPLRVCLVRRVAQRSYSLAMGKWSRTIVNVGKGVSVEGSGSGLEECLLGRI